MIPAVEITNLRHTFAPGTVFECVAVDDVSLAIMPGETVAIIGHTGSGKSTLIQHLNGLLRPTAGSVKINGCDIFADKKTLHTARRTVGLVFQYPEYQLFESTVFDDVAFGPRRHGLGEDEVRARAHAALEAVGLSESQFSLSPFELSGGQKRRAAIAGVLALQPQILVMDEPAAGLDPMGREEILSQILDLQKSGGMTVILVSHSMADAARMQRVFVMERGSIFLSGSAQEIFCDAARLNKIGLDVPPISDVMMRLAQHIPRLDTAHYCPCMAASAILAAAIRGESK